MAERESVGTTRNLLYFENHKGAWVYGYGLILLIGLSIFIGVTFHIIQESNYVKPPNLKSINSASWYLAINGIVAFIVYAGTRRNPMRTLDKFGDKPFVQGVWVLMLLSFSPAFFFVELFDKIYLVYRKLFKGDQEELNMEKADGFVNYLKNSKFFGSFFRTVDLNTSERFTYLFGNLSYDREDAYKMFVDGTDIVRTPVLICSFFVALCLSIPVVISAANKESVSEKWVENIAPVTTIISALVLLLVLGTLQGYGDKLTVKRDKKYREDNNAANYAVKAKEAEDKAAAATAAAAADATAASAVGDKNKAVIKAEADKRAAAAKTKGKGWGLFGSKKKS